MILRPKCKKVSQVILTTPVYLVNNHLFFTIEPAQYQHLYRSFGHLCSSRVQRNKYGNAKFPNCRSPSRSFHGSRYSQEEYLDTPSKDWRRHLKTFEQYQYQSDLGQQPSTKGPRLLDEPAFNTDFELWLELVLFRRRQQDINNLRTLYHVIIGRDLHIPTAGATADGLWNNFLYLGWETHTVWDNVIPYARRLQELTGRSWLPLYAKILMHYLRSTPQDVALWHTRLCDHFKPSSADMKDIFGIAVASDATLRAFKRMYMDFSIRDLYSTIIPQLCNEGNYKRALEWHHIMMTANDLPSNTKIAEPLSHHLAIHGKTDELISMTTSMAKAGIPAKTSANQSLPSKKASLSELLNRQLGAVHNISPKRLSDETCARLFATPAFPIDTLVKAIHMLGVDTLGPISLRELVSREFKSRKHSASRPISQCLDALRHVGISTDDSTFCTVVSNLAIQGDERLLEEVVNCDMHPDAFEDQHLQESLLARYYARDDYRQVSRTLAILTAKCEPESLQRTVMNLILRSAGKVKDLRKVHQQLDIMQEKMVPVSAQSARTLRRKLLSPRRVSKMPASVAELPSVIAMYQGILRNGGDVHLNQWREILLRLGMVGLLSDLKKLSLWLAEWYSSSSFRASESSFFKQKCKQIPEDLAIGNPRHPLRILFPAVAQQAFVAWGFQHSGELYRNRKSVRNSGFTWRWGIEVLWELKQRKVLVLRNTLSRACRLRFTALIGDAVSRRLINRTAWPTSIDQIMDMAQEIEKIWGSEVFIHPFHKFPQGDARRLEMLKRQILHAGIDRGQTKVSNPRREMKFLQDRRPFCRLEYDWYTASDDLGWQFDNQKWRDDDRKCQDDNQT